MRVVLPGPVVADDSQDLAGVEIEADAVEAHDVAVGLHEAPGRQYGHALALRAVFDGVHLRTFLIHWSMATAPMTRMPTARV